MTLDSDETMSSCPKALRAVAARTRASIPAAMDALAGVLEVQLHALVDEAGVARHDDRPARAAGGHAGHVEPLLPLLVDPLKGERV